MKKISLLSLVILNLQAGNYGSLLLQGNCITCHHETKAISAPSLHDIQQNYLNAYAKKSDFIQAMSQWVLAPDAQTSIMAQAVKKYELMPQLNFQKDVLEDISAYIYETDFK